MATHADNVQPLRSAGAPARSRRVFVRDLVLDAEIGVHAHEKNRRQRVRINIDLTVSDSGAPHNDQLRNVVCYEDIVEGVKSILTSGHINLVETLSEAIADLVLADLRVSRVRVRIEKLDAVPEAESVGVELERFRDK